MVSYTYAINDRYICPNGQKGVEMFSTIQFLLICILLLICSVLSFFAGRSGCKTKVITVKQFDIVENPQDVPSKLTDLYLEEEAFVPGDDSNVKKKT